MGSVLRMPQEIRQFVLSSLIFIEVPVALKLVLSHWIKLRPFREFSG